MKCSPSNPNNDLPASFNLSNNDGDSGGVGVPVSSDGGSGNGSNPFCNPNNLSSSLLSSYLGTSNGLKPFICLAM